jgi:putative ABC transport system permease protein
MRRELNITDSESRNVYTFIGLTMILFWGTPFDSLDWIVPDLDSNIEMFFLSGICMVAAAVWVIIYNADLITNALTAVLGRVSKIRPSLKTAIAYPLNSRLRTGLTLAMLALVIFTLVVMSSLTSSFNTVLEDIDSVTGGWDIVATVSYNNPIEDIDVELSERLGVDAANISAVGGYTTLPIEARQIDAEEQEWKGYTVRGATLDYLEATQHGFALMASEYGETDEDIWKALREDPTLAVIDAVAVPSRGGGGGAFGGPQFKLEGFAVEDDDMPPTEIEIREPRNGTVAKVTIIAVLDLVSDQFGVIMFQKTTLDAISPETLPLTTYRFRLEEGVDAGASADALDAAFLSNGLETEVLADELEKDRQANVALNNLLQGFMATGLLVGIAALGVISLRSVVERRQQIGVLRAIGYRRSMVLASFLMESSFIALLGIMLGVGLGTLLSYNLVNFIGEQVPGLRYSMPWFQLGLIVSLAYAFSLLTTFLPARQASRIYPAQALRYE